MTTSVDEAIGKWAAARPRRYEEESNRPGVLIMTEVRKKSKQKSNRASKRAINTNTILFTSQ
jgi:hypothetical protein